jgi:hypothetical protein
MTRAPRTSPPTLLHLSTTDAATVERPDADAGNSARLSDASSSTCGGDGGGTSAWGLRTRGCPTSAHPQNIGFPSFASSRSPSPNSKPSFVAAGLVQSRSRQEEVLLAGSGVLARANGWRGTPWTARRWQPA